VPIWNEEAANRRPISRNSRGRVPVRDDHPGVRPLPFNGVGGGVPRRADLLSDFRHVEPNFSASLASPAGARNASPRGKAARARCSMRSSSQTRTLIPASPIRGKSFPARSAISLCTPTRQDERIAIVKKTSFDLAPVRDLARVSTPPSHSLRLFGRGEVRPSAPSRASSEHFCSALL